MLTRQCTGFLERFEAAEKLTIGNGLTKECDLEYVHKIRSGSNEHIEDAVKKVPRSCAAAEPGKMRKGISSNLRF